MDPKQIESEVKRRYPINERERRGCQTEKQIRGKMRDEYRDRLRQMGEAGIKKSVIA